MLVDGRGVIGTYRKALEAYRPVIERAPGAYASLLAAGEWLWGAPPAEVAILGDALARPIALPWQEQRGDRCHVTAAGWGPWGDLGVAFEITANRFLHHMVRYLVGTMVDAARGRRPLDDVLTLLRDRHTELRMSPPAPPEGLFLTKVHYPGTDSELD